MQATIAAAGDGIAASRFACVCALFTFSGEAKDMGHEARKENKQMTEKTKVVEVEQTYFRPEEAAKYLRVGRTTMYSILKQGLVPSVTHGKTRIVRRADLDDYVSKKLGKEAG
jgi:excisionase family DNA binding protein